MLFKDKIYELKNFSLSKILKTDQYYSLGRLADMSRSCKYCGEPTGCVPLSYVRFSEVVIFLLRAKFIETPDFVGLYGHGTDTINQINEWIYLHSERPTGYFMEFVRKL